jgi:DNA-binding IclR family transcriptional regulator
VRFGTVLELRAAQSRVLLAFQSDPAIIERMHASLSPTELDVETRELEQVRRRGVAWADLGRLGLSSVAVPVFGPHDIQAALALLGTSESLPPDDGSAKTLAQLADAAQHLSGLLTV